MRKGKLIIREKQIKIITLNRFFGKLLGLSGRYPDNYFPNYLSIHTVFMKANILIYFLSKRNLIVKKIKENHSKSFVFGTLNSANCIECFLNELIEIPMYEKIKIIIEKEENCG